MYFISLFVGHPLSEVKTFLKPRGVGRVVFGVLGFMVVIVLGAWGCGEDRGVTFVVFRGLGRAGCLFLGGRGVVLIFGVLRGVVGGGVLVSVSGQGRSSQNFAYVSDAPEDQGLLLVYGAEPPFIGVSTTLAMAGV